MFNFINFIFFVITSINARAASGHFFTWMVKNEANESGVLSDDRIILVFKMTFLMLFEVLELVLC